jgi:hypothetical protein
VVTRIWLRAGATPQTLQRLLTVSGTQVYAFVSPTPLWKNLSTDLATGAQRVNVAALQAALKKGGSFAGAKNLLSGSFKDIYQPCRQGSFRPHNSQVDFFLLGSGQQPGYISWIYRQTFGRCCDTGIPRRTEYLFYLRALGDLPHKGVFPSSASNN